MPEERRYGKPKTEEERRITHEAKYGKEALPPRGTGLKTEEAKEGKLENRGLLLNMAVEAMGSPGIVVNPDVAARTPCRCYKINETKMCFSKGIIGTLSKPQREAYCTKETILTEGIARRVKLFKEAAKEAKKKIAGIAKGERLEPWLHAMGEELRKRGVKV